MTWLEDFWHRVSEVRPVPDPGVVLGTGVIALLLVLVPATWRRVRLGITAIHEAGHAVVAVLVGRRLQGVRLHADTSGVTLSKGRPTGPGMVAMLAAGYLAPAAVGLGAAALLAAGRGIAMLWALLALVLALLAWVRNWYGAALLVLAGLGLGALTWSAPPEAQSTVAYLVAWLLLIAAPVPLVELLAAGRRRSRTSDPDQLARLTRLPGAAWCVLLLVANLGGLALGVLTLAPDVIDRLR
ncbi:M50 family metallopeptidase [Nocardioides sp. GXZ039]|uniref:M50 family metallopeptidase n=1 Tax=Nocardioides sp. GXZ039 TaxID=3136018 RepID=UPI0030F42CD2